MTALFEVFDALRERLAWASLAELPTAVEPAPTVLAAAGATGELWLKRDDQTSAIYGGNKLRLLEPVLGEARAQGCTHVYASGARGSNFAVATALHAPRVGLAPGVICFPQPMTPEADESQRVVELSAEVIDIAHWSLLPLAAERLKQSAERDGKRALVMSQVALGEHALLGYLSAGLELAKQVQAHACPAPTRVVLPIGSAATAAGVLAGLGLAKRLGIWSGALPTVAAVRIAPWPLSRRGRVLGLAERALAYLASARGGLGPALSRRDLPELLLVTDQLGSGYPHPTPAALRAQRAFAEAGYPILDGTYAGKAAAHLFAPGTLARGPVLFWATKSSAPLPRPTRP